MLQDVPKPGPRALWHDAATQMARLVFVLTLADLAVRRAGQAAFGLRLSEENGFLRQLTELSDLLGPFLERALLVGAVLLPLLSLLPLFAVPDPLARVAGCVAAVGAGWVMAWRLAPASELAPVWPGAAALLATAVWAAVRRRALLGALVGALFCSLWLLAEPLDLLEKAGEVLLLGGLFIAWPLEQPRLLRAPPLARAAALALPALVAVTCAWNRAAWVHVVRHLFHIHAAGIPTILVCALLAGATFSLTGLALSGRRGRGLALGLFLLLCSARGSGPALAALRVAAAAQLAWAGSRRKDQAA